MKQVWECTFPNHQPGTRATSVYAPGDLPTPQDLITKLREVAILIPIDDKIPAPDIYTNQLVKLLYNIILPASVSHNGSSIISPTNKTACSDLAAAVHRQAEFVRKMKFNYTWLRGPTPVGTIQRARGRYEKFMRLIAKYRGNIFVPTNDIDLVWHTQQANPWAYYEYTTRITAGEFPRVGGKEVLDSELAPRFVDHNDRLKQDVLSDGFDVGKKIWAEEYGTDKRIYDEGHVKLKSWWKSAMHGGSSEVEGELRDWSTPEGTYAVCTCWVCEFKRDVWEAKVREAEEKEEELEGMGRNEEWVVRATVVYYKALEKARREGRDRVVWDNPLGTPV